MSEFFPIRLNKKASTGVPSASVAPFEEIDASTDKEVLTLAVAEVFRAPSVGNRARRVS